LIQRNHRWFWWDATMAMRRDIETQPDLIVFWADVQRSPGHAFYDKLQKLLSDAGSDRFVEDSCKAY